MSSAQQTIDSLALPTAPPASIRGVPPKPPLPVVYTKLFTCHGIFHSMRSCLTNACYHGPHFVPSFEQIYSSKFKQHIRNWKSLCTKQWVFELHRVSTPTPGEPALPRLTTKFRMFLSLKATTSETIAGSGKHSPPISQTRQATQLVPQPPDRNILQDPIQAVEF
jgi:hypothetical protein